MLGRAFILLCAALVVLLGTASAALAGPSGVSTLARDAFPSTGFQIFMAVLVAVILIGGGIALRRFSRSQRR